MAKINIAVIGAGNISQIHVLALQQIEKAKITVVCNKNEARGRPLAARAGADWVQDAAAVAARDDVDILIIGTPSGTHEELAVMGMQAGKHVLVEKPLEITLSRIDHMLEVAAQTGMALGCIFQSRMSKGAQAAQQAISSGRLGDLVLANALIPWSRNSDYYKDNWRGTWALDGGGALMNQSIHSIDLLHWLAGDVDSIMAAVTTRRHAIETEDTASAVLQFKNGAQGIIQGTTALSHGHGSRVELLGTLGAILLEDGSIKQWQLDDADAEEEQHMLNLDSAGGSGASDPMAIGHVLHQKQIEQFLTAVQEGTTNYLSGHEARKSVEIVRAIYHASATGTKVQLPFANK
jgi:UDP-N-acetyl-2-amino-2-deoxyglucuronate dehydrogenase